MKYRLLAGAAALSLLAACGASAGESTVAQTAPVQAAKVQPATVEQLPPAAFAKRMRSKDVTLINVHVPDEGEIAGTDVHIPYLSIAISEKLPADKNAALLIYCRSGHMSAEAGQSLVAAGYTRVAELTGGFEAWKASGRKVVGAAT